MKSSRIPKTKKARKPQKAFVLPDDYFVPKEEEKITIEELLRRVAGSFSAGRVVTNAEVMRLLGRDY